MNNKNKIWKSRFLGKLDKDGGIFRNDRREMQYKIKIISSGPSDFPNDEVKNVTGFSDSLKDFGYMDQVSDKEEERKLELNKYLENNYLIFSVRESEHSNPEMQKKYYNSFDLLVTSKEQSKKENQTFEALPLIMIKKGGIEEFTAKIVNEEYIGKNEAISLSKDDSPPFIIINEMEADTKNSMSAKVHVLGPIAELKFRDEYGVKFIVDEKLRAIEITKDDLLEFYPTQEGVIFITGEISDEIEKKLKLAPLVAIKPSLSSYVDNYRAAKIEDLDEMEFLERFETVCKSNGLVYDLKDLYNFHTAMKTQSFVILAGMSGTGKSKLVQCYYETLFEQKTEKNLLFIPVRPFWQDDSDLLGYLDTLNSVYRPGDSGLVDFILEANTNEKECYIVCLDEMNLARVEHYFSQFLSILERDVENRVINLYNPKVENRIFNKNDYPSQVKLGENIFFVGTVNIDESTFSFSDKVLDRANVINLTLRKFMEVKEELDSYELNIKLGNEDEIIQDEIKNTYSKLQGMKKDDKKDRLNNTELELLWRLHRKINKINHNQGIGMRIVNQIEQYLMNLPESVILTRKVAFDLQVSQRVFTKLRGSEGQLTSLVGRESNSDLIESEICILFDEYEDVSEFATSRDKLKSISRELQEYGHTL